MDFTTNQWVFIALVLVAGWLLGMMSRSGGGRWKTEYQRERDAHLALRRDYDAHMKAHPVVPVIAADRDRPELRSGAF
jgi:hypothetical protein